MTDNTNLQQDKDKNETETGLTPRELVMRHIENPEDVITEEDLSNLRLQTPDTPQEQPESKVLTKEEIENMQSSKINPTDILGK